MRGYSFVILSNYGLNSNGGGVKVYTQNLVKKLLRRDVSLFLLIREGIPMESERKLHSNKFLYALSAFMMLARIKPKFILAQGGWFTAIPAMMYKIKNPQTVVLYLYHTHYDSPISLLQKIKYGIERLIMNFVLSRFDCVLFVSRDLRKNVEEVGVLTVLPRWGILYGAPSVRIPNKMDISEFKMRFGIKGSIFYILGLGLTALPAKAKGAKILIDALSQLPENVYLILTRRGGFVKKLRAYAESRGVKERVIFTGDLKNPHVATVVADVYTHITYGEGGLSLALLEVMSIGKPIIASKVGGIPEAIRHPKEGILVDNDVSQIANAIKSLISNPKLRRKMSVISKGALNKRFSWEKTADKLLHYFSEAR